MCRAGVHVTDVFVDTVGDADRYALRLTQRFPSLKFKGELSARHRVDNRRLR